MKTIKLLGELGKNFGKEFKLDVKTPIEAFRALCVNFPSLEKHLIESEKRGVGYRIIVGTQDQKLEELTNPSGKQTIKIVPVLMGAGGNGSLQIILGVAIIALMWWNPMGWAAGGSMIAAGYAMGASLVIGGTVQMLTPMQNQSSQDLNNSPDNKPSYTFNGAVNTSAQGYPVPVGYGRMIVGSAVISAGIVAEELP